MRQLTLVCMLLLLLSGFAAAQATVIAGYASNWVPSYGVYAAPYVPLVVTPSATLATLSPNPVGASNATYGNVAGASNATLSIVAPPPVGVFTQPVWYGPSQVTALIAPTVSGEAPQEEHAAILKHHAMELGLASSQGSHGLATLAGLSRPAGKASRTWTNQDVDHMNQNTGTVKWDGKTEKL